MHSNHSDLSHSKSKDLHVSQEDKKWEMPEWAEPYRDLIRNTGGNDIEWLMNLTGEDTKSNVILGALSISVDSQMSLLCALKSKGHLKEVQD